METPRLTANKLPCLFKDLIEKYSESLSLCETKENQIWRYASGNMAVKKINVIANYLPELPLLLDSLNNYSLCEKHYNQIIAKDYLLNNLKKKEKNNLNKN
jgi:hypothetical protein